MEDIYPSRKEDHPLCLARKDPVLYSRWQAGAPLSRERAEAFRRDGYLVLAGVFTGEELALLQNEQEHLLARPPELLSETVILEPDGAGVRSIFAIHRQSALMERLARDARLAEVARFLLGDEVYISQSRLNYKPGFEGREFAWHSDFETWHVEDGMPRMRALSMSVLLAENSPVNGPLLLLPGSHRTFLACVGETPAEHYRQSLRKQEYGVPDRKEVTRLAEEGGIVAATGKAGDVVVFDCNILHGSGGNITPFPRSNAFFVYNAVSNRLGEPFGAQKPRPAFTAERTPVAPIRPVAGKLPKTLAKTLEGVAA